MKKIKYSKLIVLLVIILNIIFTGAAIVVSLKGFYLPDSLIVAWFSFTGTELISMAGIKVFEKHEREENDR